MKNTTNYSALFAQKRELMDILDDIMRDLDYKEESTLRTYDEDGEEQSTDRDGNLLYRDENGDRTTEVTGEPIMKTKYKERMLTYNELSDRDKAKYDAIQTIKEALLKLA